MILVAGSSKAHGLQLLSYRGTEGTHRLLKGYLLSVELKLQGVCREWKD